MLSKTHPGNDDANASFDWPRVPSAPAIPQQNLGLAENWGHQLGETNLLSEACFHEAAVWRHKAESAP